MKRSLTFQAVARRCMGLLLCLIYFVGCLAVPARADFVDGVKYNLTTIWDFMTTGTADWNLRDAIGSYTGDTWMEKYANFVDGMITGLGTDTIGEVGYVLPLQATGFQPSRTDIVVEYSLGDAAKGVPAFCVLNAYFNDRGIWKYSTSAPVTGWYTLKRFEGNGWAGPTSGGTFDIESWVQAGDSITFSLAWYCPDSSSGGKPPFRGQAYAYALVRPHEYSADGFSNKFGGAAGRPGNLDVTKDKNIKFGVSASDGSVSVLGNVGNLFNEGNKTYYNPQTQSYEQATNWMYDYSDRSYTFDTNNGAGKVVYGDDMATVTLKDSDGNTITYNFNYMIGEGVTPPPPSGGGTTPPPSGGGSTGNSNNSNNEGSWFGDVVINIGDIIGNTIGALGGGSGEEGGGSSDGGFFGWLGGKLGELLGAIAGGFLSLIQEALGKVLDGLIYIVELIAEKLRTVVDTLLSTLDELPSIFEGFTGFLEQVFSFLPPEFVTIITFGILMLVLVTIVKHFLG